MVNNAGIQIMASPMIYSTLMFSMLLFQMFDSDGADRHRAEWEAAICSSVDVKKIQL